MAQVPIYIPADTRVVCSKCENDMAFHEIPVEHQLATIVHALGGVLECDECKQFFNEEEQQQQSLYALEEDEAQEEVVEEKKIVGGKAGVIQWIIDNTGCSNKRANAIASDLSRAFDVVPVGNKVEPNSHVLAIVYADKETMEALGDLVSCMSPVVKNKAFVLVSQASFDGLHLRYTSFARAKHNLETARENKLHNIEACARGFVITKEALLKDLKNNVLQTTTPTVSSIQEKNEEEELVVEKKEKTKDKKRALIDLVADKEEEEEQEEEKVVVLKKSRNRISSVQPAYDFLASFGFTKANQMMIVKALRKGKGKGGQQVFRPHILENTFVRTPHSVVTRLLTEQLIEPKQVSAPFDSTSIEISKGKHVCIVAIQDEDRSIFNLLVEKPELINELDKILVEPTTPTHVEEQERDISEIEYMFLSKYLEGDEEVAECLTTLGERPFYLNKLHDEVIIRWTTALPPGARNQYVKVSPFIDGMCFIAIENREDETKEECVFDTFVNDALLNKPFETTAADLMNRVKDF
jgi:hypothetical protein